MQVTTFQSIIYKLQSNKKNTQNTGIKKQNKLFFFLKNIIKLIRSFKVHLPLEDFPRWKLYLKRLPAKTACRVLPLFYLRWTMATHSIAHVPPYDVNGFVHKLTGVRIIIHCHNISLHRLHSMS